MEGPPTDGADLGERATSPLGALLAAAEVDGQWVTLLSGRCPFACSMAARGGGKNATDPAGSKPKQKPPAPLLHSSVSFHRWNGRTRREHVCLVPTVNSLCFCLLVLRLTCGGPRSSLGALTHSVSPHQQQKQYLSTATCYVVFAPLIQCPISLARQRVNMAMRNSLGEIFRSYMSNGGPVPSSTPPFQNMSVYTIPNPRVNSLCRCRPL